MVAAFTPPQPLDFVFIDADTDGYDIYYEALLPHVRPGGLVIFDNMLAAGSVIGTKDAENVRVRAIKALNEKLSGDTRIQGVLVPLADGLYLCRKL
jgi:caffeoyl-CoA O-methyltransferase